MVNFQWPSPKKKDSRIVGIPPNGIRTVIFPVFSRKIFPTLPADVWFQANALHVRRQPVDPQKKQGGGSLGERGQHPPVKQQKCLRCAFWNLLMLKSWRIWFIFWAKRLVGYTPRSRPFLLKDTVCFSRSNMQPLKCPKGNPEKRTKPFDEIQDWKRPWKCIKPQMKKVKDIGRN